MVSRAKLIPLYVFSSYKLLNSYATIHCWERHTTGSALISPWIKGDNTTAMDYFLKVSPTQKKQTISGGSVLCILIYRWCMPICRTTRNCWSTCAREKKIYRHNRIHCIIICWRNIYVALPLFHPHQTARLCITFCPAGRRSGTKSNSLVLEFSAHRVSGAAYALAGEKQLAEVYFNKALALKKIIRSNSEILRFSFDYIPYLLKDKRLNEAKEQAAELLELGNEFNNNNLKLAGAGYLQQVYDSLHNTDSAYYYSRMEAGINAQLFSQNNINKMQTLAFNDQIRVIEEEAKKRKMTGNAKKISSIP